ncbi:hypothetical protein TSMEX_009135 [Taenia solium]|eukprot:TsM_000300400 transcript=TsM_000300400 gene=TsM_000300400
MQSLLPLVSLFLLLAFASHSAFTAIVVTSETKPRLKTDLADEPDLLKGKGVVEGVNESEAIDESSEDDESENVLAPAGPRLTPLVYKCVYDYRTGRKRCYPQTKLVLLRR